MEKGPSPERAGEQGGDGAGRGESGGAEGGAHPAAEEPREGEASGIGARRGELGKSKRRNRAEERGTPLPEGGPRHAAVAGRGAAVGHVLPQEPEHAVRGPPEPNVEGTYGN